MDSMVTDLLRSYAAAAGEDAVAHLQRISAPFKGARVVHVNSTKKGGGVAEILNKLVPLTRELGVNASWEIISGHVDFFQCTKNFHNAIQGNPTDIPHALLRSYEETNARNAEILLPLLKEADYVFIHDPQPAALIKYIGERKGKWIWRCHVDASRPQRSVWKYLSQYVTTYDASIFSLVQFAQALPHAQFIVPPSIDPLSEKNTDMTEVEVKAIVSEQGVDTTRPFALQVSRFDRFKDPTGVIRAFQLAREFFPTLQLVLAGGAADDDPEGEAVLKEVLTAANKDSDIHILLLPPDSHRVINALQRAAAIVLQKSIREGFGLTVTEAMWKGKPVIGGDTGGIRLQIVNHYTGFLVGSPEGASERMRYMLRRPARMMEMGRRAREFVRDNFLITRELEQHFALMIALQSPLEERITVKI